LIFEAKRRIAKLSVKEGGKIRGTVNLMTTWNQLMVRPQDFTALTLKKWMTPKKEKFVFCGIENSA
jgi:hypothetical protein